MKINIFCYIFFVLSAVNAWAGNYVYRVAKGLEMSWQTTDRVGITTANISYGYMEQLSFSVSSTPGATRNESVLFATGYQLKAGTPYYAYFPYKWSANFNANNIPCEYKSQIQDNNGNADHIAKADYQLASATTSDNSCSFRLQHIGGVMRFSFPAPEAMTIASLSLKAQTPAIATAATMDIVTKNVTPTDFSNTLSLKTQNITVEKGQQVVLYLAAPAQDLSTTALDITLTDANGTETLLAKILGPAITPGYLYDIAITPPSPSKGIQPSMAAQPSLSKGIQPSLSEGVLASLSEGVLASMFRIEDPAAPLLTAVSNPTALTTDILFDPAYTVHYLPQVKKGDVNADGDVDVLDAIEIVGYYTKGRTSELPIAVCDMNDDGEIDILDAIEIVGRYTKAKE